MKYDNKTRVGVLETWERLRTGPRFDEKEWDEKLTGKTATALKDKVRSVNVIIRAVTVLMNISPRHSLIVVVHIISFRCQ